MSATQSTFGAAGRNCRSTRSSATRTPGTWIVVRPRLRRTTPGDPGRSHQPPHAFARHPDAVPEAQLGVDAPPAVDAAVLSVDLLDLLQQPRVGQRAVRRRA